MTEISIIVPVYDESASLRELFRQLQEVCEEQGWTWEVIFVDDGSADDSWTVIKDLALSDHRVRGRKLRRNFGKAAALRAGAAAARYPIVAMLDADLQDDPAELPKLVGRLSEGWDLVNGWKQHRQDPWSRRWASRLFNWGVNWLTGVVLHDHNCGLKVARREVFDEIGLYGDRHRFIPVLAAARGFRVGEMPVHHRPRRHGRSKYGWSRLPIGLLDLLTIAFLTSFNHRPQHLIGALGLGSFLLGLVGLLAMVGYWILRMAFFYENPNWEPVHQRPIVIYSVAALLLGAQLLCLGFLAELITERTRATDIPFSVQEEAPHGLDKDGVRDPSTDGRN